MPTTRWEPAPRVWRDRPVAVTGATGFLGSHLTSQLVELGARVAILERDEVPTTAVSDSWREQVAVVRGDISDQAVVERLFTEYEVRTVFHLAAQSQVGVANRNPVSTFEANTRGTWTLLEAVRRSPRIEQVIVASSNKAYGAQPVLPYTEEMPLLAVNPYDVSKACADLVTQAFQHSYGVPACITRCGNFFGPGDQNWERIVPSIVRALLQGEAPVVRSDGTPVRDYLFVVDGALAYLLLAEAMAADPSLAGEAFNFSTETPITVLELVDMLQQACGTSLEPIIKAEAGELEIACQYLSAAKAHDILGWQPRYTLREAIDLTVAFYRDSFGSGGAF